VSEEGHPPATKQQHTTVTKVFFSKFTSTRKYMYVLNIPIILTLATKYSNQGTTGAAVAEAHAAVVLGSVAAVAHAAVVLVRVAAEAHAAVVLVSVAAVAHAAVVLVSVATVAHAAVVKLQSTVGDSVASGA
jgi:hypothetical protein